MTETVTSPTLARQLRACASEFPEAKWHQYEPAGGDAAAAGARLAFGTDVAVRYHFEKADVILALDADFLADGPGRLRYAREFAARREPQNGTMNRLYAVEPAPTVTGTMADHRLASRRARSPRSPRPSPRSSASPACGSPASPRPRPAAALVDALADDLQAHKGTSLVVAGETQPPLVHALAAAINEALGNVGKTVEYLEPVEAEPVDQIESLPSSAWPNGGGRGRRLLLILGGNPAYNAPADSTSPRRLEKVGARAPT